MSLTKRVAKKLLESLPGEGKAVKDSVRGLMVQKELAVSKLSRALSGDRHCRPGDSRDRRWLGGTARQ